MMVAAVICVRGRDNRSYGLIHAKFISFFFLSIFSPAQVGFTPGGNSIIVTIKAQDGIFPPATGTGSINEYIVTKTGAVDADSLVQTFVADGTVPFSFAFDNKGNVILAEAFGDQAPLTPEAGALSLYGNSKNSASTFLDRENTGGTATCWVRYVEKTGCTFTTNNGGSISSLKVAKGEIKLLNSAAATLDSPLDFDLSPDDKYLYALSAGEFLDDEQPRIHAYKVDKKCVITEVQVISDGLPDIPTSVNGVVGLATY